MTHLNFWTLMIFFNRLGLTTLGLISLILASIEEQWADKPDFTGDKSSGTHLLR